jgi:ferredoxin
MKPIKYRLIDRLLIPKYDTPSQMQTGNLDFDREKCKECGVCVQLCPGGCLLTDTTGKMDLVSGKAHGGKYGIPHVAVVKAGASLCIACFDCGAACPHGAISIRNNFNPGWHFKRITQLAEMKYPKRY